MSRKEHAESLYRELTAKLRQLQRKELLLYTLCGLLYATAASLVFFFSVATLEALLHTSAGIRTLMVLGGLSLWIAIFAMTAGTAPLQLLHILHPPSLEHFALRIGRFFAPFNDRLSNALQLYRTSLQPRGTSAELALAGFLNISQRALQLPFEQILETQKLRRALLAFLAALLLFLMPLLLTPAQYSAALNRLWHFQQSFIPPPPFTLLLAPEDTTVARGSHLVIRARVQGSPPEQLYLHLKTAHQEQYRTYALQPDADGIYRYQLNSLKRSLRFYVSAPWHTTVVRSATGHVRVVEFPAVRIIRGIIYPPAYTKQQPTRFNESNADLSVLYGSRIQFTALTNKPVARATLVLLQKRSSGTLPDTITIPMQINHNRLTVQWTAKASGTYFIRLEDSAGYRNRNPIHYTLSIFPDAPPTITLLSPTGDVQLHESAQLPIQVAITDDFGFSKLRIYVRLVKSAFTQPDPNYTAVEIPLPGEGTAFEIPYLLDFAQFHATPGDQFECFLEVLDNDLLSGPKPARTAPFFVHFPSLDEVFQAVEQTHQQAEQQLQQLIERAAKLHKQAENVRRELLKQQNRKINWEQQKKIEDILKEQQRIEEEFKAVQQQLQKMVQQLQEHRAISRETLEKYQELQKLMQEVHDPLLQHRAQQLQKALQQLDPQQLQKMVQEFQFDEESFRQRLERTLKILKRLKAEQKADELAKRSEELAKQQQELEQQLENANPENEALRKELTEKQRQLEKELEQLRQAMQELENLMKEIGQDMPLEELQKAMEQLEQSQLQQDMQQAAQQMQSGNYQQARQSQKRAIHKLQQFAQQMQNLRSQMQQQVSQEAIRTLQQSIQSMLELSQRQEQLKNQTAMQEFNSAGLTELARQQAQLLEALRNVIASLTELSEKSFAVTPQMGQSLANALRQMQHAIQQLSNRAPRAAARAQQKAMGAMNACMLQMQNALSMMQGTGQGQGQGEGSGPGSAGFMQQLQQMALEQQIINQGMQQLLQQMQGERLTEDAQHRLGRLAAQQRALQQSLQELAEQQQRSPKGKRILGDLKKIAEDMKEIATDMESGRITEETLRRQERILSRLLDATRSLRERDFEKKREAQTAKKLYRETPPDIDLQRFEAQKQTIETLLRSLRQRYAKDYEHLIRRYFEALQHTPQQTP